MSLVPLRVTSSESVPAVEYVSAKLSIITKESKSHAAAIATYTIDT
ncbi:MAG: hypothetical protein IJ655_04605 [Lachnospiraceae bacterium]|nr:hypothetical protein [Lachnospiraceae bacterium]